MIKILLIICLAFTIISSNINDVIELNDDNFEDRIEKDIWLVHLYNSSSSGTQYFDELREWIKEKKLKLKFGKIDIIKEKELISTIGTKTTGWIYVISEKVYLKKGDLNLDEIKDFVEKDYKHRPSKFDDDEEDSKLENKKEQSNQKVNKKDDDDDDDDEDEKEKKTLKENDLNQQTNTTTENKNQEEEKQEEEEEEEFKWPNDPDTVVLNQTNFEEKVSTGDWIIDFYAVWCPHCQEISSTWASFATKVKTELNGVVNVGKVNIDDAPEASMKYGVEYLPTILFLKSGKLYIYDGGEHTEKSLIEFINETYLNKPYNPQNTTQKEDEEDENEKSEKKEEKQNVSQSNNGDEKNTTKNENDNKDDKESDKDDKEEDEEEEFKWPNDPDTVVLNQTNFEEKVSTGDWIIDFYAVWCPHCQEISSTWASFATKVKTELNGVVNVGKVNIDDAPEASMKYGVEYLPTILFLKSGKLYIYDGGEHTEKSLIEFINETYLNKPYNPQNNSSQNDSDDKDNKDNKDDKDVKDDKDGKAGKDEDSSGEKDDFEWPLDKDTTVLTKFNIHKTLSGLWIIDFYAEWCPHCQELSKIWEKFSTNVKKEFNGKINVGKVDIDHNEELSELFKIEQLPTILVFESNNAYIFEGEDHSEKSLLEFVNGGYKKVKPIEISKKKIEKISKTDKVENTKKSDKKKSDNNINNNDNNNDNNDDKKNNDIDDDLDDDVSNLNEIKIESESDKLEREKKKNPKKVNTPSPSPSSVPPKKKASNQNTKKKPKIVYEEKIKSDKKNEKKKEEKNEKKNEKNKKKKPLNTRK